MGKKVITNKLNMRMIFSQDFNASIHYNGFKIDSKYGNYNEESFTFDSNFQILISRLRG